MAGLVSPAVGAVMLLCALLSAPAAHSRASTDSEEAVGESTAALILGATPLLADDAAQRYLNLVGASIASITGSPYQWRFAMIDSADINAFALPGGIVLVTKGMATLARSEDELAYVLAHEIAHVLHQHHYRVVLRQRAAVAANSLLASDAGTEFRDLSIASAELFARGLDKRAEFQADRVGVIWMARAGYDPAAALGILESLSSIEGNSDRADWLFATHPSPMKRLDHLLASGLAELALGESKDELRKRRFQVFRRTIAGSGSQ